jgi:hypothetical protein
MLETSISELHAAVIRLTQVIEAGLNHVNAPAAPTPAPAPAPVIYAAPAPVVPVFAAPTPAPAAAMPPPPVFAAPPAGALPFSDGPSLISYTMGVYKAIGPAKGAGLQQVLTDLGVVNLTDVKPEQYATFYTRVEALKG